MDWGEGEGEGFLIVPQRKTTGKTHGILDKKAFGKRKRQGNLGLTKSLNKKDGNPLKKPSTKRIGIPNKKLQRRIGSLLKSFQKSIGPP